MIAPEDSPYKINIFSKATGIDRPKSQIVQRNLDVRNNEVMETKYEHNEDSPSENAPPTPQLVPILK